METLQNQQGRRKSFRDFLYIDYDQNTRPDPNFDRFFAGNSTTVVTTGVISGVTENPEEM